MRVFIYGGGLRLVGKSGVGQAIFHQREMLRRARIETTHHWLQKAGAVHINTVLPDSVLAALAARGESTVTGLSHIERGYAEFVPTLRHLGAEITIAEI